MSCLVFTHVGRIKKFVEFVGDNIRTLKTWFTSISSLYNRIFKYKSREKSNLERIFCYEMSQPFYKVSLRLRTFHVCETRINQRKRNALQ